MSKEVAMKKLLQACGENPELLTRLMEKPQEVTKEYGVALEPEELQQLQRVKKLKDLVEEFKLGRVIGPHVGYPIDVMWKTTLATHILFYKPIFYPIFYRPIYYTRPIFYPIYYPIFYPIGYYFATGGIEQARQFSGLRSLGKKRTER
jgi:hypothetical protein